MSKQLQRKIFLTSILMICASFIDCKQTKPTVKPEPQPGPVVDLTKNKGPKKETTTVPPPDQKTPPPNPTNTPAPKEGDKPPEKAPKEKIIPNPFQGNTILKNVFEKYGEANVDLGFAAKDMENILESDVPPETNQQEALIKSILKILESKDKALWNVLPVEVRMKLVFELAATVPGLVEEFHKKTKTGNEPAYTSDEIKMIVPLEYASQLDFLFNVDEPNHSLAAWVQTATNATDGKEYRTLYFGQIDFSAGIKKKSLSDHDKDQIQRLALVWNAWLTSSAKPTDVDLKIVGYADRDKPANAEKNKTVGLARAQMVYDEFIKNYESFKQFKVKSLGDALPNVSDAKSKWNRRVEIVIRQREVVATPAAAPSE